MFYLIFHDCASNFSLIIFVKYPRRRDDLILSGYYKFSQHPLSFSKDLVENFEIFMSYCTLYSVTITSSLKIITSLLGTQNFWRKKKFCLTFVGVLPNFIGIGAVGPRSASIPFIKNLRRRKCAKGVIFQTVEVRVRGGFACLQHGRWVTVRPAGVTLHQKWLYDVEWKNLP